MSRDRFRREHEDLSQAGEGLDIDGILQNLADRYVRARAEDQSLAQRRGQPEAGLFQRFLAPESDAEKQAAAEQETARVARRDALHAAGEPEVAKAELGRARTAHHDLSVARAREARVDGRPAVLAPRAESDADLGALLESFGLQGAT